MRIDRIRSLLALTAIAALAPTAMAGTAARPSLRLVEDAPLVVRGASFEPQETVLVRVSWRGTPPRSKRVTAGQGGGFTARFRVMGLPACSAMLVTATGTQGSRAALKLVAKSNDCIPPPRR